MKKLSHDWDVLMVFAATAASYAAAFGLWKLHSDHLLGEGLLLALVVVHGIAMTALLFRIARAWTRLSEKQKREHEAAFFYSFAAFLTVFFSGFLALGVVFIAACCGIVFGPFFCLGVIIDRLKKGGTQW